MRGAQKKKGDRIRHEIPTKREATCSQLGAGAVPLQDLPQLQLQVLIDFAECVHEAGLVARREKVGVVQQISAKTAQSPHLLLADIRVGRMCPQPPLQQLDESRAGIVAVGADTRLCPGAHHGEVSGLAVSLVFQQDVERSYKVRVLIARNSALCGRDCEVIAAGDFCEGRVLDVLLHQSLEHVQLRALQGVPVPGTRQHRTD
mmetsp:Transcript_121270/g.288056  ORF Transcript_121270/g.288056 Transcript_121270/m.288056 type:complete len:203 (-) Transcript_121270:58-666(-)